MAVLQIKRGPSTNLPALTLLAGELAFSTDTGKLYVGNGASKVLINPDIAPVASAATQLETARIINVVGSEFESTGASFDGTANANVALALKATGVAAGTYTKLTVDAKGRVTEGTTLVVADIPTLPVAKISGLGDVATLTTGIAAGNIPVLDANGKLNTAVLPPLSIVDTHVCNNEAEMLALTAQKGDIAIRPDIEKTFILQGSDPAVLGNWIAMVTPTDKVLSINGRTGVITLAADDVGLGNVTNESKATMFTSPVFTGTPTAPTALAADDSTQIATTAFVKLQGYLLPTSTIDGGTF